MAQDNLTKTSTFLLEGEEAFLTMGYEHGISRFKQHIKHLAVQQDQSAHKNTFVSSQAPFYKPGRYLHRMTVSQSQRALTLAGSPHSIFEGPIQKRSSKSCDSSPVEKGLLKLQLMTCYAVPSKIIQGPTL